MRFALRIHNSASLIRKTVRSEATRVCRGGCVFIYTARRASLASVEECHLLAP